MRNQHHFTPSRIIMRFVAGRPAKVGQGVSSVRPCRSMFPTYILHILGRSCTGEQGPSMSRTPRCFPFRGSTFSGSAAVFG